MIPKSLIDSIKNIYRDGGNFLFLTGAGISAESGIPTFRGQEGYWTVGSQNYHPQDMATHQMWTREPKEMWRWYLYRKTICDRAKPNAGHHAIKQLEDILQGRFALISQNIDGLHRRAGNSEDRMCLIHGNYYYVRCGSDCSKTLYPFPQHIDEKEKDSAITDEEWNLLTCPECGSMLRPNILWFDEYYNEEFYRFETAMHLANNASALFIIGTSGATTGPNRASQYALQNGALIVDLNTDHNVFSELAQKNGGYFLQGKSGEILPELVKVFEEAARG
jgi:NAD-dependent deacetylase